MATGHWLTNRGKLLLSQGAWDDDGAGLFKAGLLVSSQPAAVDTAAEVADLNTVNDLLVTAACTECSVGGYSRQVMTRSNAAEDDANDRINLDAADIAFGALATGQTLYGLFVCEISTDTNDTTRQLVSVDWFASTIPTNGGTFTYAIADLYRLS